MDDRERVQKPNQNRDHEVVGMVRRRTETVTTGEPRGSPSTNERGSTLQPHGVSEPGRVEDYRLYDGATAGLLGAFDTEKAAWRAADAHSLEVLARSGGWIVLEHMVVSCAAGGRAVLRTELTHVGPPDDLDGCAAWLSTLPGRS